MLELGSTQSTGDMGEGTAQDQPGEAQGSGRQLKGQHLGISELLKACSENIPHLCVLKIATQISFS